MEGPIISPWLIYFINFTPKLMCILFVIAALFAGVGLLMISNYFDYHNFDDNDFEAKKEKKRIGICVVFSAFFFLVAALIPNTNTCYQMLVAHYVTYENIDYAGEQIKDITDYVFDKIEEVNS